MVLPEELIKAGANIELKELNGGTPLHIHAENADSFDVLETLLKHGANAGLKDKSDLTPLDIAKNYNDQETINLLKSYLAL